jgi:hypothetical protein
MTAAQTENIPLTTKRIVVPVGSGMSLAGIIAGLDIRERSIPILGVVVGADPRRNLNTFSRGWEHSATLVTAGVKYQTEILSDAPISLDPIYEAKAWPFIQPGDLFWAIGHRALVDTDTAPSGH